MPRAARRDAILMRFCGWPTAGTQDTPLFIRKTEVRRAVPALPSPCRRLRELFVLTRQRPRRERPRRRRAAERR
jgi:hypothetical protein